MVLEEEWVERIYYGGNLPREAERLIHQAALSYHRESEAEKYLQEALECAPNHIAVYIGLYKFYFYKGKLREALQYAVLCLERAAKESHLSLDWRNVQATDAEFEGFNVSPKIFSIYPKSIWLHSDASGKSGRGACCHYQSYGTGSQR